MRSFHIAFDRGQTIMWFKKQEDLDAAFSMVKQLFMEIAQRFEGKLDIQKGITISLQIPAVNRAVVLRAPGSDRRLTRHGC